MRLKAEFWIKAYLRTCSNAGCPGFVVRHGDDDAGAIYIKVNHLDGTASLYGPAPAGFEAQAQDRQFAVVIAPPDRPETEADAHIARQFEFDPDLWVVEIEDQRARHFLDDWLAA